MTSTPKAATRPFLKAIKIWQSQLGNESVLTGEDGISPYQLDTSAVEREFGAIIKPQSVEQIQDIVRTAQAYQVPVQPVCTGNNWGYGGANPVKDGGVILDLSGLNKITLIEARLGVVKVEPGVTQQQLREFLDQQQLDFIVPTTGAGPHCSLLGNVMERGFGITPVCDHFQAVTSFEAVLPDGSLYQPALREMGGEQVDQLYKWGVGPYFDGIFTQSSFAVVTAMTCHLEKMPEQVEAFYFRMTDEQFHQVDEVIAKLMQDLPGMVKAVNLMNRYRLVATLGHSPQEFYQGEPGKTALPEAVVAQIAKENQLPQWLGASALYCPSALRGKARQLIKKRLKALGTRPIFINERRLKVFSSVVKVLPAKWQDKAQRSLTMLAEGLEIMRGQPNQVALPICYWRSGTIDKSQPLNPAKDGCGLLWYMALVPADKKVKEAYAKMVKEVCLAHDIDPFLTLTTLSERCYESTVPLLFDKADEQAAKRAHACYQALVAEGVKLGVIPNRFNVDNMALFEQMAPQSTAFINRIRRAFDPNGIIASGRYGAK